jgi:ABC-2 type transport system ATP-binding protein
MAAGSPVIETFELCKSYWIGHLHLRRARPALKSLSLSIPEGEVFGIIGPNGAGKTTTLKILMGLMYPDSGSARILGVPLAEGSWRQRVGYLPEHPYFYDYLTASEYVDYAGALFGIPKTERRERGQALLDRLGLGASKNIALRRYSKGMLQRLGLAQALINNPDLVVLDEPMSGLDPLGRRMVRDLILELKAQGKTVLFSTHILPDAEALCDRVGLIKDGQLVNSGRLNEILNLNVSHLEILVSGVERSQLPSAGVQEVHALGERWRLGVSQAALPNVIQAIVAAGGRVLSVQEVRQSLEDYFFQEMAAVPGKPWAPQD